MRKILTFWEIAIITMVIGSSISLSSSMGQSASKCIAFDGVASGGQLTLTRLENNILRCVSINTTSGESAVSVATGLVRAITNAADYKITLLGIEGTRICLYSGPYVLAGTETGLNIPDPPTSLSASLYDPNTDKVVLRWINPSSGYDTIKVPVNSEGGEEISGTNEAYEVKAIAKWGWFDTNELHFAVIGYKDGHPSNAGILVLKGNVQEELMCIPYRSGIMPNWMGWSNVLENSSVQMTQAVKSNTPPVFDTPDEKPYYQMISGSGTFKAGTWRKFLGLTPGATYELSIRVNTLAMDSVSNWTYSVHATHNGTNDATLSVAQLSGEAVLPDGSSGAEAGQIVKYQAGGPTTKKMWARQGTSTTGPGRIIGNITLPSGVTSITVWTRHTCASSTSTGVGLDWIALKKLN